MRRMGLVVFVALAQACSGGGNAQDEATDHAVDSPTTREGALLDAVPMDHPADTPAPMEVTTPHDGDATAFSDADGDTPLDVEASTDAATPADVRAADVDAGECTPGTTRECYSGPAATRDVGRCRG